MLSDAFADKHRLCDYGQAQATKNSNQEVRDVWDNPNLEAAGTVLFWIASRAQVDKKLLVQCATECAAELLPHFGDDRARGEDAIRKISGWAGGSVSRDEVEKVSRESLAAAMQSKKQDPNGAKWHAWSAISSLARCIRFGHSTPGFASKVASTAELGGDSAEAAQRRMAAIVRRNVSWDVLEHMIRQNLPSPAPRKKTADEVAAESERIQSEFAKLLDSLDQVRQQKASALAELGTTPEKLSAYVRRGGLGSTNHAALTEKLAELDAEDAPESSKSGAAPPRRPRMSV